ncbi:MAG: hypothetical protein JZU64_17500 [Rhodoferax sp.]|nr:hypothetical protein [Rhodoferax sp.]
MFNASRVLLQAGLPDKAVLDVTGQVQSVDQTQRSTQVLTQDGQTLNVSFAATDTLPAMGETVRVEGFWKDNTLQVRDLSRPPLADQSLIHLEGIVDAVASGQFSLNGLQIFVDPIQFATLQVKRGERVEILVKLLDGRYRLVRIESKPPRR